MFNDRCLGTKVVGRRPYQCILQPYHGGCCKFTYDLGDRVTAHFDKDDVRTGTIVAILDDPLHGGEPNVLHGYWHTVYQNYAPEMFEFDDGSPVDEPIYFVYDNYWNAWLTAAELEGTPNASDTD